MSELFLLALLLPLELRLERREASASYLASSFIEMFEGSLFYCLLRSKRLKGFGLPRLIARLARWEVYCPVRIIYFKVYL